MSASSPPGVSPYATGGGGVTFERRVSVTYLTHLLVGSGPSELGDDRHIRSVAFQQAPEHAVDDLVVHAARRDEADASLVLAVGVRRCPKIVQSDKPTRKLIGDFVDGVVTAPADGPEHRFALVVAGHQQHAQQLARLADLASKQRDAASYFDLLRTPGKFDEGLRGRLDHVERLVANRLAERGTATPNDDIVRQRTWQLLSHLSVQMPRLEAPDKTDWAGLTTSLAAVARDGLDGAARLRDRLVALAAGYAPAAATVDLKLLRRDAHAALDSTFRRHRAGWRSLNHLNERASSSVRAVIESGDGSRRKHVDRSHTTEELLGLTSPGTAVLLHGISGVGKSALVVRATTATDTPDLDATQRVCINLRHLPATTLEFESALGVPLAELLEELSAPRRLLVIDGADAVSEGRLDHLRYLIDAAHRAGLGVIAVSADDGRQPVHDALSERFGADVLDHAVPGLTDPEIDAVVEVFRELADLAANSRSRELLRRLVVIDLLVRGGVTGVPLSDADAMQQVWHRLVCREDEPSRGSALSREVAMLRLAELELMDRDRLDVIATIDAAALEGLAEDGLLRRPSDDLFSIGPEFAHDEVRRYATARLLLAGGVADRLRHAGAPRWALSSALLACQASLAAADTTDRPLTGRYARLQADFDALVAAGYGERWGDVPGEALLTGRDPEPVLRDAWPALAVDDAEGLKRLCRLVDQRLRDDAGIVRILAVEPFVRVLLDDEVPWWSTAHVRDVLRGWLRALVIADTPAGYRLRERLRDVLVTACKAADAQAAQAREAAAAAVATRDGEETEGQQGQRERVRSLPAAIGLPRRRRRQRSEVPQAVTDEVMIEYLALLGPDLGEAGEAILVRVARDAPWFLAPAVEELLAGRALSNYRRGFLAELTDAYYVDEGEDGSGACEDGIRDHCARSVPVTPLSAWFRGPFLALFQSDLPSGVVVLNRMLNHAARARVRTLLDLGPSGEPDEERDVDASGTELSVTGTPRIYIGDPQVWVWYRGTGVGPYPCLSALQALEIVCDQLIEQDVSLDRIVTTLLENCENLAMLGLVVGLLIRHVEKAGSLLDPFLAEPAAWNLEFGRVVHETSGLAASHDVAQPERRRWSLREAATLLVLSADDDRAAELRALGDRLVDRARQQIVDALTAAEIAVDDGDVEQQLAHARAWASGLDRASYRAERIEDGLILESRPPDDVARVMEAGRRQSERSQTAVRLMLRYGMDPQRRRREAIGAEQLEADLGEARRLLEEPAGITASDPWDVPAAVAAHALESVVLRAVALPDDLVRFAVDAVLDVANGEGSPRASENERTYFEDGADRSAARALPLLWLPSSEGVRGLSDGADGWMLFDRALAGGMELARAVALEVRLHLARGLDHVWPVACAEDDRCHHEVALDVTIESLREAAFGEWDVERQLRRAVTLEDPLERSLAAIPDDRIHAGRLEAAIRALAPASVAETCVSARARGLLATCLSAQRRALRSRERDMDLRGTHALVAGRALLTMVEDGDAAALFEHVTAMTSHIALLGTFLRALSAAAEEHPDRAATARRLWPDVVAHVIEAWGTNAPGFSGITTSYGVASLVPTAAGETSFLYREVQDEPIRWWEPSALEASIESWLPFAVGRPACVDQLVGFVNALPARDQVRLALPWIAELTLPEPDPIARRTSLLPSWLADRRSTAVDVGMMDVWQRVVDALVVAGEGQLSPYSE